MVNYVYITDMIFLIEFPDRCPVICSETTGTQLGIGIELLRLTDGTEVNPTPNQYLEHKALKPKQNKFVFESFHIDSNETNIRSELQRLIQQLVIYRDKYDSLDFHLENSPGGDLIPVHILLLVLCGSKQPWMTPYHVIQRNYRTKRLKHFKWDPWELNELDGLKIDINTLQQHRQPYKGKINLYVNEKCGSSTWYFITYMIYAFASKINRQTTSIYGRNIKLGSFTSKQLKLHGYSTTSSGDGNSVDVSIGRHKYVSVPLQENIDRPVKTMDWNRFWIPSK